MGYGPVPATRRVLERAGIALVTIDNGEDYRTPTTLGRSAFESAAAVIGDLERGDWSAAVFTGKPFVFCVGADVDELATLRSPEDALEGVRARTRAVRAHS